MKRSDRNMNVKAKIYVKYVGANDMYRGIVKRNI
jgi:hypothetical protein